MAPIAPYCGCSGQSTCRSTSTKFCHCVVGPLLLELNIHDKNTGKGSHLCETILKQWQPQNSHLQRLLSGYWEHTQQSQLLNSRWRRGWRGQRGLAPSEHGNVDTWPCLTFFIPVKRNLAWPDHQRGCDAGSTIFAEFQLASEEPDGCPPAKFRDVS